MRLSAPTGGTYAVLVRTESHSSCFPSLGYPITFVLGTLIFALSRRHHLSFRAGDSLGRKLATYASAHCTRPALGVSLSERESSPYVMYLVYARYSVLCARVSCMLTGSVCYCVLRTPRVITYVFKNTGSRECPEGLDIRYLMLKNVDESAVQT